MPSAFRHRFRRGKSALQTSSATAYSQRVGFRCRRSGDSAVLYRISLPSRFFSSRSNMSSTLLKRVLTGVYSFQNVRPASWKAFRHAIAPLLFFFFHVMQGCRQFFTSLNEMSGRSVSCLESEPMAFDKAVLNRCAQQWVCKEALRPRTSHKNTFFTAFWQALRFEPPS